ncbi:MAG: type II toxin-antitoxin system HipA family toxin [Alphaproteobacteria bacterium]|nr:type II toxin-antitoxin system HipA family toxin [Alphaproteobacteria bacterium]
MPRTLDVYLSDRLVGRLIQEDTGQLQFAYDAGWLEAADARPISQSLPLRADSFSHRECRPFFSGLLPEAEKREVIARVLGVTARNDFILLDRLGGECAGAITFVHAGDAPPRPPTTADYRSLSEEELARILRSLPERPLLAGEEGVRLSLAGAQDKLPVLVVNDEVALPLHGAPSSHIVKPQIRRFQDTVQNEAFCLMLANRLGLHVVPAEVRRAKNESFLLVARYDRVRTKDGGLRRLHQEDFCQALGVPPELKYQNEGGPSLADCFELVRRSCGRPAVDLIRLLDYVIFNFLIGNHDAHGKNYSIVHTDHGVELAPLYDVVSTTAYPDLSSRLAMKVGDKYQPDDVLPRHWDRFARDAGLAAPMVRRRMLDIAQRVTEASHEVAAVLDGQDHGSPILARIIDLLHSRSTKLRGDFEQERELGKR